MSNSNPRSNPNPNSNAPTNRRLGRGLAALLGDVDGGFGGDAGQGFVPRVVHPDAMDADHTSDQSDDAQEGQLLMLSIDEIVGNPFQPRRDFNDSELSALAESLKDHDMLQPVLVRRHEGRWQLISGERRMRAAVMAGWKTVPARVREADDRLVAELAMIENLQRKDLNPIEKALSFKHYLDQHHCTQDDLGRRIKVDRSTIANLIRLLDLPEPIQEDVQKGILTAGHARALLPLGDEAIQIELAQRVRREGLSVRDVEQIVQDRILQEDCEDLGDGRRARRRSAKQHQMSALEHRLRLALGTKVDVKETSRGRGQIVIQFRGHDEYKRIESMLLSCGSTITEPKRQAG